MNSLRKFTLTIKDLHLRKKYLEENSRTIFKTALYFTMFKVISQAVKLASSIKFFDNFLKEEATTYVLLGVIFLLQILVVVLTWVWRNTKFLEFSITIWITLTYFYMNPSNHIKLSTYIIK